MEVGFIGTGVMGSATARNLAKAGHKVRAWNRSGDPGTDCVEMVCDAADAFAAEAVFTMRGEPVDAGRGDKGWPIMADYTLKHVK